MYPGRLGCLGEPELIFVKSSPAVGRRLRDRRSKQPASTPPPPHVARVDVERSGEEEERQHPVHQGFVEIDVAEEPRAPRSDVARRQDPVDREASREATAS